ncbi:zinc finger protein 236-like [Ochlerotatus camptorhynchus]|uniref:zinc finger protein 236-like n=1 Tax=Ochlerotatus camptorhynchus TaxID=644619 RepID=UPI0031D5A9FC
MDGMIVLDDELHLLAQIPQQHQQQLMMNYQEPPSSSSSRSVSNNGQPMQYARRGRGTKRTRNGTRVLPAADMIPQIVEAPEPSAALEDDPAEYGSSVIVDGQDIYYIQEVQDDSDQAVLVPDDEPEFQYLQPNTIVSGYVGSDSDEAPELTDVEQQLAETEEYFRVEPMELSDIWNDLITANQEILILLELSDLKHHIVDARRIEVQIRDMACEYCGRNFPDIHAWNRHVKKIHFQTELFDCDSCDGQFKHFARFKDHLNGHTGQRVYQCDECNHQYAFRMGFLVHKILDHMKLNGIYVCPKCDLDCRDAQNYKLHIASHIEFGPSPQRSPGVTARPVTTTAAARPSSYAVRKSNPVEAMAVKPPFYVKENERNKFLNVYESFSKNRKVEHSLPITNIKRKKHQ